MANPSLGGAPKVAIPRLYREPEKAPQKKKESIPRRTRVGRACLNCRQRKIKCSGDLPQCANCTTSELECAYEQARRDRLKSATSKNKDLTQLLRELSLRVDSVDRALINEALETQEDETASITSVSSMKRRKIGTPEDEGRENSPRLAAPTTGPFGAGERSANVKEDLLRSREARELGYVGQGAEVYWLHSLQDHVGKEEPNIPGGDPSITPGIHAPRLVGTSDASFYLDSQSAELDIEVDPYEMPTFEHADRLLDCYMTTVHKSFPILQPQFVDQLRRYFTALHTGNQFTVSSPWLAIVNIVFAIGARYSHLVRAEWQGEERDHLIYLKRALGLLGPWPFAAAPDLAMIQVFGLLSFYYQAIGHVNRAWVMIGVSVRLALTLGLHLRNDDPKISAPRKEALLRTWWSLHAIECLLSAITGRPCMLSREDCTVPFPDDSSNEEPNSASSSDWTSSLPEGESPWLTFSNIQGNNSPLRQPSSYLDAHLTMGLINQKLLSSLYSPQAVQQSWDHVKMTVPALLRELDEWRRVALPEERLSRQTYLDVEDKRGLVLLRFYYSSTKILITRPCLCRVGRKRRGSNPLSTDFDQNTADECVEAALDLTRLLLDEPDPVKLYQEGPWWSIAHHIMQAMTVLLLEFSYCTQSVRSDPPTNIQGSINKLLRWIRATRSHDPVMVQAHKVVVDILKQDIFRSIAKDLLVEEDFLIKIPQRTVPNPIYAQPSNLTHPMNMPGAQCVDNLSSQNQFVNANASATSQFPQPLLNFGQQPMQQEPVTQMNQPQYQTEPFPFMTAFFTNQYLFDNTITTEFDQTQSFGYNLDDLWPGT